jgi:hypothetical protein
MVKIKLKGRKTKRVKKVRKKGHRTFRKEHCSLKNCDRNDSCLDNSLLLKVGNILNEYHKSDIDTSNSRKMLHKQISDKISQISNCESEKCWLTVQEIIRHLSPEELRLFKKSFKPQMPASWKKDPDEWLSTSNLDDVLKQLVDKYPKFHSYGALPMDFEEKEKDDNSCISGDLCNIDLREHFRNQKHNIGVVFNLDDHDEPGSHWTAMYVELEPCCRKQPSAYYFDSVGSKPTKEVHKLVTKLKEQYKSIKDEELEFLYNDIPHQKKDTECGIYCLHFLETMLKGTDFDDYIQNERGDEYMQKFRSYFFAK